MGFIGMSQHCKEFILDTLFPKFCVGCQKEGTWLCEKCLGEIVFVQSPACPNCQKLTPKGQFCSRCRQKSHLTGIISACYWHEGSLKEAVHTFKYDGIKELSGILSSFLIWQLKKFLPSKKAIIVPIPLHKRRLAQRGFNQAGLLAENVALYFNLPIPKNILAKTRYSPPQVELKGKERRENIKGAFDCKKRLKGKTILLIDDVATTGATLQEAAKVLRSAGARQVWGLVLAKG